MKKDTQVAVIEKELSPLLKEAREIEIKAADDMKEATELLSQMNIVMDRVTVEKERITRPALDILAAERSRWSPLEKAYKAVIEPLRAKIGAYQTELTKRARKEEERVANRIGEGKGKFSIETGVRRISEIERPAEEVVADSGKLKFRESVVLKIVDAGVIPREYLVVDEKKCLEVLKGGGEVLGCVLETIMIPVNTR